MQGPSPATAAAAATLLALSLLAPPVAAANSKLWGRGGSLWTPAGRLMDFSFAGYHQGNDPLPDPPVTKSVLDFKRRGMSDTAMLQAALSWANKQRPATGYTVLLIPKGTYTLTEKLIIKSSRVVLRGEGPGKTVLNIPKSLTDVYGPDPYSESGGYVNWGGFLTIKGRGSKGRVAAVATGAASRGDVVITVNSARGLKKGQYYDLWFTDVGGRFNSIQLGANMQAPEKYIGKALSRFTVKVLKIRGNKVTLERPLPFPIAAGVNKVALHQPAPTVTESGVEGMTLAMKWELYAGHHLGAYPWGGQAGTPTLAHSPLSEAVPGRLQERGWNGVELMSVRDCWVRDIEIINPDSGVVVNWMASASTVTGIRISYTKTRANSIPNRFNEDARTDGHWGMMYGGYCYDMLFTDFHFVGKFQHDVGTAMAGQFGV
ncbi:hypothetical protein CHLNCDRAFT_141582 [Chlorella variabilis]|uniref:Pectate lyase superfamily protein domain-containing protein n=1 Tax=Chlorella variabilis TaxID=554065 RepID=E1ZT91_CHLVA|nr:hypothetical protein CHLNCDRAFT_141582 [Chlorella variabilis]EFN50959.1 hypothetical protein CHLNCDRAFT_141582 [Chlorella variabilis]|eukprot:XP_005843061.1 hypothetical protein CHLNCDRAFT_141582 [Chlorella variabilis]